jgi:hypothetical protein
MQVFTVLCVLCTPAQVAAFCATGQVADASGQAAITSVAYSSSLDRAAFVQANGIVNIYPLPILAEEARQLSTRRWVLQVHDWSVFSISKLMCRS